MSLGCKSCGATIGPAEWANESLCFACEQLPFVMGQRITRLEIMAGLRAAYHDMVQLARQTDPDTVGFPDMEAILDYIDEHGLMHKGGVL